jgi:type II secretory pathway predicted ATPase ExeA
MDYLDFYSLKEHPFTNVVDNRFYYDSAQHSNALIKLMHSIENKRGLAVVMGDIGTGKTTLARKLLEELDEDKYEAALLVVVHSSVSSDWLLKKLALQLGLEDAEDEKFKLLGQIYKRLNEIREEGKSAVVLMDEVQMLNSQEIMEEIRGLLNMEMDGGKLINFAFFGLNELEDIMNLDKPLRQRVAMRIALKSFTEEDAHDYILHRLKVAGCTKTIFSENAINAVYCYSKGRPRLINTICDNCLLEGFLIKAETIDKSIVKTAAFDLGLDGPCDLDEDDESEGENAESSVDVVEVESESDEPSTEVAEVAAESEEPSKEDEEVAAEEN